MAVVDESGERVRSLTAVDPATGRPLEELAPRGGPPAPQGQQTSQTGLTRAGVFALPVHPLGREAE